MNGAEMKQRIAEASPRFKARLAGGLWLLSFLVVAFTESFVHGPLNIAGGLIAVSGMVVVTLLLYGIFKPVSQGLSLIAAFSSLVGLGFEALRWQPLGMNVAIVFSGCYCLLLGILIFRSTFLPRPLGALMTFSGLGWLTYLSTPIANLLSPYNLASGVLGEALVMLWLLVIGLNAQKWSELAAARRLSPT
jgi:Domain of unknown function (DUF4386)